MGPAHCRKRHSFRRSARAGSGNGTRSEYSLEERGHPGGPSSRQRVQVLQPSFIIPKKDVGLCPILDLRHLNGSVMRLKFRMIFIEHVVSQTRSEDWFVTINLKDAYFHISILPHRREFLRFALGAKFTYTGFFLSALHSHPALSRSVWMLFWLLCDSRASTYSTTLTFG